MQNLVFKGRQLDLRDHQEIKMHRESARPAGDSRSFDLMDTNSHNNIRMKNHLKSRHFSSSSSSSTHSFSYRWGKVMSTTSSKTVAEPYKSGRGFEERLKFYVIEVKPHLLLEA
jgi:hypothetical protein